MGCFTATCAISQLPIWAGAPVYGIMLDAVGKNYREKDFAFCYVDDIYTVSEFVEGEYNDYGSVEDADGNIVLSDRTVIGKYTDPDHKTIWNPILMVHKEVYDEMLKHEMHCYRRLSEDDVDWVDIPISQHAQETRDKILAPFDRITNNADGTHIKGKALMPIRQWLGSKRTQDMYDTLGEKNPMGVAIEPTAEHLDLYQRSSEIRSIFSVIGKPLQPVGFIHSQDIEFSPFRRLGKVMNKVMSESGCERNEDEN